ncbi:hypothetical protein F0562_006816 [Nyssa sinensis]|uniref:Cation/H+ exchanger domain-containing protein n=1 Tax=Nyssa sinensis TaxID=561372 RepID=A0A5J5AQM1_9ASTE|nr:hypothetical protein F0562_006816 [Nyssa sinensis]
MDATRRVACNEELFNPVLTMGMQVSCILVLSHFFQLVLKPFGHPAPIAQMLAGFVLGPSGLSHIDYVKKFFFQNMATDYYETMSLFARILIMFLIGLEMDVPCLMRNLRPASIIASGSCITCCIFAAAITPFIYQETSARGPMFSMTLMVAVTLANAASPIVVRIAAEMSIIGCFLIGSMFPRGGKTARTLLPKLTYSVHNFILPIYFGYTGFQADVTSINSLRNVAVAVIVILLSLGGKIIGSLFACHYLKIPLNEGVLLAFLMTMKGHVDLLILTIGLQNKYIMSQSFYSVTMATLVINTLIAGPVTAYMVRRESDFIAYRPKAFALHNPDTELRVLACVHNPRPVATMLGIIAASRGSENVPITPYLLHLIELPEKTNSNLMYHQREDEELSDDEDYGGNDVVEINDGVDTFFAETGVMIHQVKAVSPFASMYVDVCDRADDIRASIILIPFHKHRRIDGKMESSKDGIRTTNQKVLRHAHCSVAVVVDRGLTGASQLASGSESLQHVAILFFGGPDDREALGFSRRLGMHHHINLTVIRFLPASLKDHNVGVNVAHKEDDVLMAISDHNSENEADTTVLTDFYNRYVTSGQVGYVEKHVENGEETASALRDMADIYSLFVVGKGGRGQYSPLTTGMSDWEECPELGTVGDLLASSDFDISGSVLVIQHYRPTQNDDDR